MGKQRNGGRRLPDYKEMYRILFRETTEAIYVLQKAQQQTEEMYMTADTANRFIVMRGDADDADKQPPQG